MHQRRNGSAEASKARRFISSAAISNMQGCNNRQLVRKLRTDDMIHQQMEMTPCRTGCLPPPRSAP
ncbi:hypothetical protein GCM10007276_15770 [Agaricicola taiwanensis]|uniref:Uncharacterized protein n=1 Tax=Agaricicola taiwanensis TaxID=591372 RepID=A0A8J2VYX6_9RHOB|nr:hypothetical protein GCM10007276_15770 [Agaricicola taiwanensis]